MQNQHTSRRAPAQAQLVTAEEVARRRRAKSDDAEIKKFTSWKLDLQSCLLADPRLKPADKLVAVCILSHVNSKTRITFPSAETISDEICVSRRHVLRALGRLKDTGWLIAERRFNNSNIYRFNDKNVNGMLDRLLLLKEDRKAQRGRKQNAPLRVTRESPLNPPLRVTRESPTDVTPEAPLHLKDLQEVRDSQ